MIDFIFLGDSLTFGYGVKPKDNWVHKLSEYLKLNILNSPHFHLQLKQLQLR